jgi:hypothetical protein
MLKLFILILFSAFTASILAQNIIYSPKYFGPNANQAAELTGAIIPEFTTVDFSGNYYFGFGDQAINPELKIEIPLLPRKISLKLWVALWEKYSVDSIRYQERNMLKMNGITNGGDIYVQTRISVFEEKKYRPAVILNSTLRSASGGPIEERRYYDTPGYYFDLEAAKSFGFNNVIINDVRVSADFGFLCWEMSNSRQSDAIMYGGKIILSNKAVDFEHTLSGYSGRINSDDKVLVYSAKLIGKTKPISFFVQYKYGIRDWNYHQLQAGISFQIKSLTPKY